ncbi:MAG: DNA repair exonuclease [Liquorilactobacillus ghanensis]|jgi:DNA repair exonuclease SbcCD nuclease subunit|uniref:Calcineurin-like phosphoesterase domain-containing protein n=2 Tax=Liquorilactobacillus TaxID=2767888 RepID=A0A0R1VGE2_9LACO|nr:DNA repair exonuclease [Liquorilactobacillus ghanensis]KRM04736.1 hypothetical protein FC89_GL001984 [Liquorilactobacillus ghanensis DSM 18630]
MKIIHCADLHLDSQLTTHLAPKKARERRAELLSNFSRLVDYAWNNKVAAIVIAGDLFDTPIISVTARNLVLDNIKKYPSLQFYYLTGNHENDSLTTTISKLPSNLHLFTADWRSYCLNPTSNWPVVISGVDLNNPAFQPPLTVPNLAATNFNLVVLHGQISAYHQTNQSENIALEDLQNSQIDYLALGHLHQFQSGDLSPKGKYCYAGCLEGRGFDELGQHGFVELTIDEKLHQWNFHFVPFAQRELFEIKVEITDCKTTSAVLEKIKETLKQAKIATSSLLKIILFGQVSLDSEHDLTQLQTDLNSDYYLVKLVDQSTAQVDYTMFAGDISLKGEFVRLVQQDQELDETQRAAIVKCGLQALNGEDLQI